MFLSFCVLVDFFRFFKQFGFWGILGQSGNHASRLIRDVWSQGVSLILAYFLMFLSFSVFDDFFCFSINSGFWVFLVHPTLLSVLLSALVEICFVSRMRDFWLIIGFGTRAEPVSVVVKIERRGKWCF